ncbi:hypothetical protein [Streptomyces sp. NPDC008125]|uniref:hypothetical protein n=1 Tax=Streptomyces sp. NPDC008125 TaxID=3364811 RepID=UPI0036E4EA0A
MTAALGPAAGAAASPSPRTSAAAPSGTDFPAVDPTFSGAPGTHLPHRVLPSPVASPSPFSPSPPDASPPRIAPAPAGQAALTLPATTPPVVPPPLTPSLTPPLDPSATPFATPSQNEQPFAGRPAGEGRVRPGRSLSPQELAEAIAALENEETPAPPSAPASDALPFPSSEPVPTTRPHALGARATEGLRSLSLGSGIALAGIGLAFLGARMRRAD